jgi:branched-chain amino acid transport system substrate-binding protein
VILLLVGALTGCGQSAGQGTGGAKNGNVIKIGIPLSMSGKGANYGDLSENAAKMAEEEINKTGGVNGTKVQIVIADTRGDNQEAVNLVRRYATQDKTLALVGMIFSAEVQQSFPVANQLKVPIISNSSASPGIMDKLRPWGFRNTATEDKLQAETAKLWVDRHNVKRVAIVADVKDAYAKDLGLNVFPSIFKQMGLTVVNADNAITYNLGDTDFSAQVTRLKSLQFDGVAIGGQYSEGALFVKEMRRQGIKAPVIGGVGFLAREFLEVGGKDAEGVMVGSSFWLDKPDEQLQSFIKEFTKRMPKGDKPDYRAAAMYDTLLMLRDVMAKKGVTGNPSKLEAERDLVRQGLVEVKGYAGIMGKTEFDQVGDGIKEAYVLEVKSGQFVRYTK